MKRNLLISTSLVVALSTVSAKAPSNEEMRISGAVSDAHVIATKAFAAEFDTKAVALKAETGSTLWVSTLDTEAGREVVAKILKATTAETKTADALNSTFSKQTAAQKKTTVAEIAKALATNVELRKLVNEFRPAVIAASKKATTTKDVDSVPAPLTDAERIAKLNAELAAIKAANETKLAEAQTEVAELKSAAEPVTADALAAAKTAADEAKAAVDAAKEGDANYAELQAAAQATAKTFAELQAKYDAANTVESLTVQLADGQKAADEAKAAVTANPDDAELKATAEAKAKEVESLTVQLTTAQSDIAAAKAEAARKLKDAEEKVAKLAATVAAIAVVPAVNEAAEAPAPAQDNAAAALLAEMDAGMDAMDGI